MNGPGGGVTELCKPLIPLLKRLKEIAFKLENR